MPLPTFVTKNQDNHTMRGDAPTCKNLNTNYRSTKHKFPPRDDDQLLRLARDAFTKRYPGKARTPPADSPAKLKELLGASILPNGQAKPGYRSRVRNIRALIAAQARAQLDARPNPG